MQAAVRQGCRFAAGALAVLMVCGTSAAGQAPAPETGPSRTRFARITPLAGNDELARRLLGPLARARLPARLAGRHAQLKEQPIDLSQEWFDLSVPPVRPKGGYGLLVFIPPWDGGSIPLGWRPVLDRAGVIFVSAERSGNAQGVFARRMPLALLAAYNVMQRYAVDPARIYVGGFSGGSRLALRLAVAYPDLFRGALLDAGSDPIGTADAPLPPRELFERFRSSSRLVYVTGLQDQANLDLEAASIDSMHRWCFGNDVVRHAYGLGHEPLTGMQFAYALRALDAPEHSGSVQSDRCWADLQVKTDRAVAQVRAALAAGDRAQAHRLIEKLDRDFSGLGASPIAELIEAAGPF